MEIPEISMKSSGKTVERLVALSLPDVQPIMEHALKSPQYRNMGGASTMLMTHDYFGLFFLFVLWVPGQVNMSYFSASLYLP